MSRSSFQPASTLLRKLLLLLKFDPNFDRGYLGEPEWEVEKRGGKSFGPRQKSYKLKINKKEGQLAISTGAPPVLFDGLTFRHSDAGAALVVRGGQVSVQACTLIDNPHTIVVDPVK